jgi:hypothetical protein
MRLLGAYGPYGSVTGVVTWIGRRCARVDDYLIGRGQRVGAPGPGDAPGTTTRSGPRVGAWVLVRDTGCRLATARNPATRCLEYQARADGGALVVATAGVGRAAGDEIVRSIPL